MTEENAFVRDLAKAQAEMDNAIFDKVNPHFKSKYASLAAVRNAIKPLSKYGFSISQSMSIHFDSVGQPVCMIMTTTLEHISGDTRQDERLIPLGTAQQIGSDETYARRRGLSALTAIASEEDDDGNAASDSKKMNASQVRKSGLYVELEKECRLITDLGRLKQWWTERQDDIRSMPVQHRELIEEEKDRRKLQLVDAMDEGPASPDRLRASIELTKEEAELIDRDVTTSDPQAFLDDIDSQMAAAKDDHTVMEIWNEYAGIKEILSPADQDKAQLIFERHHRRLKADAAVKLMRDKKK